MPIYEYECTQCSRIEEAFQGFSDQPLTTCKHCAGKLQRIISQSTFHLKGTGWYVTDYANKSSNTSQKAAKETKDSTSSSASESKTSSDKASD